MQIITTNQWDTNSNKPTTPQINNITTLKGVEKKIINLHNFVKESFDCTLQGSREKELYTDSAL